MRNEEEGRRVRTGFQDTGNTVMIADDTTFSRELLRKILGKWGYTVVAEATDGVEAVTKYCQFRPSITFMDLIMPNKNGIDATKDIVSFDENAKVIMCSMSEHATLIRAAREAGAIGVIFKPFRAEQVMEILDLAMEM